jgi:hypothetical protein
MYEEKKGVLSQEGYSTFDLDSRVSVSTNDSNTVEAFAYIR